MNNVEIFLDKYKILEQLTKSKYNLEDFDSAIYYLTKQKQFRRIKDDLNYIREVRNLLAHKPKVNGSYPIEPANYLIETIDKVIGILSNPPTSYSICKKIEQVLSSNINDNIVNVAKKMYEKGYSNIPILDKKVVIGVFSESSMFHALLNGETINDSTTFTKEFIDKYCPLNNKYIFINKNMYFEDVQDIFNKYYQANNRITMLLVTENGNKKEKLLGIITPYDAMDRD